MDVVLEHEISVRIRRYFTVSFRLHDIPGVFPDATAHAIEVLCGRLGVPSMEVAVKSWKYDEGSRVFRFIMRHTIQDWYGDKAALQKGVASW